MNAESGERGQRPTAEFIQHLTGCQSQLYAYVCALLGSSEAASVVLQETNLILWEKVADYDPSRPFLPWAYRFAYFQVLAYRKGVSRDRLLFDEKLLTHVSEEFQGRNGLSERKVEALESCLGKLVGDQRDAPQNERPHDDVAQFRIGLHQLQ